MVVPLHWALPWQRARLWLVFAASLTFYAWRHWPSVFLLLGTIAFNYLLARALERRRTKALLALGLAANLAVLGWFKYAAFALQNLAALGRAVGLELAEPKVDAWLPLGISFFTFQVMAYLVDVWRGQLAAERSLLVFAVFKGFLGQLVAGPIVKGAVLFPQLREKRRFEPELLHQGAFLVLAGLSLKLAVADALRPYVDRVYAAPEQATTLEAWLALYGYAAQLFADFWGYSTVAVGVGLLFGLKLPFNFELPYLATSLQAFWRRWHVTLSAWFRDYLYVPLGGGRRRAFRNRVLTMTLAGLWHGASWNFVLWGFFHGLWLALEQAAVKRNPAGPPSRARSAARAVLVFHGVALLWVLFRAPELASAAHLYRALWPWPATAPTGLPPQWPLWLALFAVAQHPLDRLVRGGRFLELRPAWQLALSALLLWLMAAYAGAPADFIYFVF